MASIKISELVGSALFSDSETFMDSMRDLTEKELKISGGHGYGTSKSKKSRSYSKQSVSKSKSKKSRSKSYGY
jgi:hypothetical protein